jgi:hypothetical protein
MHEEVQKLLEMSKEADAALERALHEARWEETTRL